MVRNVLARAYDKDALGEYEEIIERCCVNCDDKVHAMDEIELHLREGGIRPIDL